MYLKYFTRIPPLFPAWERASPSALDIILTAKEKEIVQKSPKTSPPMTLLIEACNRYAQSQGKSLWLLREAYNEVYKKIPKNTLHSIQLLLSRSEVNKSLGLYTSAWWDTKRASESLVIPEILQKHIDASLELNNWSEVEKTATKLYSLRPTSETKQLIALAKAAKEHNIKIHPEFESGWVKQLYPIRSVTENSKWFRALNHYFQSKNFPIELSDIPGRGRGVRATKNIKKGQIVFVEAPIAAGTLRDDVCSHCMRPLNHNKETQVIPCPEVSRNSCTAVYCSVECRDLANSLYHPPLCGNQLQKVKNYVIQSGNTQLLPIVRLAAMSIQQGFDVTKCLHIELLHSRMEYQTLLPIFQQQEALFKDVPKEWQSEFDFEWFLELDLRFSANCFSSNQYNPETSPKNLKKFMIGLYHVASFINHDCDRRNVSIDWLEKMGNNIVITALRDITQGEEITQWYFEPRNSQSYRYGIVCKCKYCMVNAKEIETYFKKLALYGNETTNSLVKKLQLENSYMTQPPQEF